MLFLLVFMFLLSQATQYKLTVIYGVRCVDDRLSEVPLDILMIPYLQLHLEQFILQVEIIVEEERICLVFVKQVVCIRVE